MGWRRGRCERGSGSLWVLTTVLIALACASFAIAAGAAVVTRQRAVAAADLAALAGAGAAARGDGCAIAARVAARNSAVLRSCRRTGLEVEVTVVVPLRWLPGAAGPGLLAAATARAGPVAP